jgi:hypothetical protein
MVSTISAVIRISVEGGATSKIGKARFWECSLTRSPQSSGSDFSTRIFRKRKKMAGEDPLDPLMQKNSAIREMCGLCKSGFFWSVSDTADRPIGILEYL